MWEYEKKLQYPINIKKRDLKMAKAMLAQYGGPDGEFAAAMRYLNQRYSMPDNRGKALLTDIGTEEMAHVEMIATMIYQLMENASVEDLKKALNLPVATTWDELWAQCEKIVEKYPTATPLGYDSEANWFITMAEQYGADYTVADADDKAECVKVAVKKIDQAANKGIIHKNNAARKKSALVTKLNANA